MIHEVIKLIRHQSLTHTSSRARSETGVYAIHVYAEMHVADLPFLQFPLDILSYEADAFQMDRLHRIDTQLLPLDQIPLALIQTAGPDQEYVLRVHLVPGSVDIHQFLASHPHQRTQRHPVDITTGRSLAGIDIPMSVQPDNTEIIITFTHARGAT